jgi:peroxiredoxin Q/BCP
VDNEKSHLKFISKYNLNFPLIADTEHQLVQAFEVWKEKSMYGKKYMGTVRTTFLIDESGTITRVIDQVKTGEHAAQILNP